MVLASFLFATMGVGVKIASESFTTTELVFYRGIVSMIFMGVVMRANGISVRTPVVCLLYTSDAADDLLCVDLGGRRLFKKKKNKNTINYKNY